MKYALPLLVETKKLDLVLEFQVETAKNEGYNDRISAALFSFRPYLATGFRPVPSADSSSNFVSGGHSISLSQGYSPDIASVQ